MFKDAFEIIDENIVNMGTENLIKIARGNNFAYFTRNRKMDAIDVIKYIIAIRD